MAAVKVTSSLEQQLRNEGLSSDVVRSNFSVWKDGEAEESYFFSHDVLNLNSKVLRHAHMIPLNEVEALEKWNSFWTKNTPHRRRSDRYVVYADGGKIQGFLIIAIISDPGAHKIWKPSYKPILKAWEAIVDDFVHFGIVP